VSPSSRNGLVSAQDCGAASASALATSGSAPCCRPLAHGRLARARQAAHDAHLADAPLPGLDQETAAERRRPALDARERALVAEHEVLDRLGREEEELVVARLAAGTDHCERPAADHRPRQAADQAAPEQQPARRVVLEPATSSSSRSPVAATEVIDARDRILEVLGSRSGTSRGRTSRPAARARRPRARTRSGAEHLRDRARLPQPIGVDVDRRDARRAAAQALVAEVAEEAADVEHRLASRRSGRIDREVSERSSPSVVKP
jgi:hypothetical protein